MKKLILMSLILLSISCKNDDIDSAELQIYIDRFEAEANARGTTYINEISNVEFHIVEILIEGVLGQCVRDPEELNQVHIDQSYWRNATDLEKEFVVFHELGHCILNKSHTNTANSDGTCLSIMYDGNSSQCSLAYTIETKEMMIDELFE